MVRKREKNLLSSKAHIPRSIVNSARKAELYFLHHNLKQKPKQTCLFEPSMQEK